MSETFVSAFDVLDGKSPAQIREWQDAVFTLRRQVKTHMDQGLPPADIAPARGLLQAVDVAGNIVTKLFA
jgi:hypothetical protein